MDFDPVAYINDPAWHSSVYGLDRIQELLDKLGNPQNQLKFVHVAGTNGKGSVCAYVESVLRHAGYKTGLFTSPYIETFEERIRVNNENISMDDLAAVTLDVRAAAESMAAQDPENHPTEFELMCAVALVHFARSGCEICVLEVGLGGRWDATNVIPAPECCVIVRIGLDHTDLLGNTVGAIAEEKAGIVKRGTKVVSWPQEREALAAIQQKCDAVGAPLHLADFSTLEIAYAEIDIAHEPDALPKRYFMYRGVQYQTGLLASYQPSNAALAIECVEALRRSGWQISNDALQQGIATATWPGRFEVVARNPLTIIDGGHNPQGAAVLAETLLDVLPNANPVFICGILGDKDYEGMLEEVAFLGDAFVCVTPPNPRALPAADLAQALHAINPDVPVDALDSFEDAIARAYEYAGNGGVVCAFGSLYSIHDLKAALRKVRGEDVPA